MMIYFRIFILCVLNLFFLPLYFCFLLLAIVGAFLPIYPTKIARNNLKNRLGASFWKQSLLIVRIFLNYFFYFLELFLLHPLRLTVCLDKARISSSADMRICGYVNILIRFFQAIKILVQKVLFLFYLIVATMKFQLFQY